MVGEAIQMRYAERGPLAPLEHQVFSYWELAAAQREPFVHRVFPDGCIGLIYQRNEQRGTSSLQIGGGRLHSVPVTMRGGDLYWGVRLAPAACALWLGGDPALLRELMSGSQLLPCADTLQRRLDAAENFAAAIAAFDASLLARMVAPERVDPAVAGAVALIERHGGDVSIVHIAARLGLGVRQLQRRFRAATGLTPKQFARTRRLRALGVDLVLAQHRAANEAGASWSARALKAGFADQAHLTRELAALTGRSPVRFAAALATIEHRELVR